MGRMSHFDVIERCRQHKRALRERLASLLTGIAEPHLATDEAARAETLLLAAREKR